MYQKIIAILTVLCGIFIYYNHALLSSLYFKFINGSVDGDRLFKLEELKTFNGVDSELLYLSILGKVYDVSAGQKHYGPGSNYHIFVGRDASKSFITGEFEDTSKDLDDVLGLSHADLIGLENWSLMYDLQYIYKGKLIGRFYDKIGAETKYMQLVKEKLAKGKDEKMVSEAVNKKYPPCNAEWDATTGSRVWCSNQSGGIERNWEGVPRIFKIPGVGEPRCACINLNEEDNSSGIKPIIKEYQDCDPLATSCYVISGDNS